MLLPLSFWQKRAELYRKTFEAINVQRMQMLEEYEQADAEVKETEGEG